jgi:hypothetical protein
MLPSACLKCFCRIELVRGAIWVPPEVTVARIVKAASVSTLARARCSVNDLVREFEPSANAIRYGLR